VVGGGPFSRRYGPERLCHVATAGQLHLNRVNALVRAPGAARDMAALEAAVRDPAEFRPRTSRFDGSRQGGLAALAIVRADVEMRQRAFEEARNNGADGMAVIDDHPVVLVAQSADLSREF